MRRTERFLIILSMTLLIGLFMCGSALAAHDAANNKFDINADNITITRNTTSGLDIKNNTHVLKTIQSSGTGFPEITIFGDATETSNVVIIDGTGLSSALITVKINDVNISGERGSNLGVSAFSLKNGANVKLIVEGNQNILKGGMQSADHEGMAGLEVPADCQIEITSSGLTNILKAYGGGDNTSGGAGIGGISGKRTGNGGDDGDSSGSITINNVTIYATGGNSSSGTTGGGAGSGIGGGGGSSGPAEGGTGGSSGPIHINNSIIYATGCDGKSARGGGGGGFGGGGSGNGYQTPDGGSTNLVSINNSVIYAIGGNAENNDGEGGGFSGGGTGSHLSSPGGGGGDGGNVDSIIINNSTVYTTGVCGDGGRGGAAISSGNGGSVNSIAISNSKIYSTKTFGGGKGSNSRVSGTNGGNGGNAISIIITGENTEMIILSGGIGGGLRGNSSMSPSQPGSNGTGTVIIKSGNILTLGETGHADFYNTDDVNTRQTICPITFSVLNSKNTPTKLSGVNVSLDSYKAKTRTNASLQLTLLKPDTYNSPLYDTGTVTVWIPVGDQKFVFDDGTVTRSLPQSVGTDNKIENNDIISVYLNPLYTVTYLDGFGIDSEIDEIISASTPYYVKINSVIGFAAPPDYTWGGWIDSDDNIYNVGSSIDLTALTTSEITLTAIWSTPFVVAYESSDGADDGITDSNVYAPYTPRDGTSAGVAAPYAGYILNGWTDINSNNYVVGTPIMLQSNLKLTADWIHDGQTFFEVTYESSANAGDGTVDSGVYSPYYVLDEASAGITAPSSRHTFDGWSGSDGNTYAVGDPISLISDVTLTADWKVANSNGGSGFGSATIVNNSNSDVNQPDASQDNTSQNNTSQNNAPQDDTPKENTPQPPNDPESENSQTRNFIIILLILILIIGLIIFDL